MRKKVIRIIIICIVTIIIIILSIFLVIKRNREHFAMHRKYDVEKIIITRMYDKDSRTWNYKGFEHIVITDSDEVKNLCEWLYDVDTKGCYLSLDDYGLGKDYHYSIELWYEDGYIERIACSLGGSMHKWMPQYEKAYAIGKSKEIGIYCNDLFYKGE